MAVRRNYRINLRNYGNPPAIMVSQYDENYDLVFEVYDGVVPATGLNAYTVKLVGRQPGNDPALKYEFTGTVSGIANNILSFTIDTTMTGRAGKGTAEIVILDTTNDVKFASFNLPVYVEKAAVPDDAIDADVERAQEIAEEVQEIVDTAAAEVKGEAEAWAVGERDGEPVPSTDPTYHNNAKYYSEVAQDIADSIGIDATLSISGKAADAKKTGDEISSLKEDLKQTEDEIIETAGVIEELECGLTEEVKTALLACFEQVAWIGADGQTYYDALETALNKKRSLSSISAVFTQGSTVIYDTDELYALKQYLTVTATYDDGSTKEVNNYTLSGKLVAGTSTITVAYNKKTTTFNVTVTHQAKTIESISATFSSSAVITTDNALDDLRSYLTVRATYSDGTTNTVTNYTLSGSLNVGTNTITVTYSGKIATFTVNVTQAEKTLQSISAVFNQGSAVIYTDSALNDLKPYLTVTASYSDGTTQTVTGYALSGTLTEGTSIITASYGGKTATFNVTVSPVVTPKRYIAQGDIASYIGIPSISVSNGTINETSPTTFSCVVFDQSIEKMWFYLHTHLDSRRRPRYIFRKDADGSFYGIDENVTSPKLYKFALDTDGTKYKATQIIDIPSITTLIKTGDYFSTLKKEMNISNGVLTVTDADSSISFTNANCFGYWQAVYNSNIAAGMFDECEVEADE